MVLSCKCTAFCGYWVPWQSVDRHAVSISCWEAAACVSSTSVSGKARSLSTSPAVRRSRRVGSCRCVGSDKPQLSTVSMQSLIAASWGQRSLDLRVRLVAVCRGQQVKRLRGSIMAIDCGEYVRYALAVSELTGPPYVMTCPRCQWRFFFPPSTGLSKNRHLPHLDCLGAKMAML